MSPDEAHTEYYKTMPCSGHDRPSRRTLELFSELERRVEARIDTLMPTKTFWVITGIQMTILIAVIGWLATGIEKLNNTVVQTREEAIQTRVESQNTKTVVTELKTQLQRFELVE